MTILKILPAILALSFLVSPAQAGDAIPESMLCKGTVLATIDNTRYKLPRTPEMVYRFNETTALDGDNPKHPAHDCSITDVGTLVGFTTGYHTKDDINIEVTAMGKKTLDGNMPSTSYSRYKNYFSEQREQGHTVMYEGGMERAIWPLTVAYLLPQKLTPTKNNERVMIRCLMASENGSNGLCATEYEHPDNIFITYSFSKVYHEEFSLLDIDAYVRDLIESWKVKEQPAK